MASAACAGRDPQPIATIQPQDAYSDCTMIRAEIDANNAKLPSYTVADATVAYVQKKYEVRVNLYNLADKGYYVGGYNNSPNRVLPGQPRAGAVTLRYNF